MSEREDEEGKRRKLKGGERKMKDKMKEKEEEETYG